MRRSSAAIANDVTPATVNEVPRPYRKYRRSRFVALGSLALILFVVSCGKLRRGAGEPPALVIFKNEAFYEATVYVVQLGGESRRIGTVSSGRTETLRAPSDLIRGSVAI